MTTQSIRIKPEEPRLEHTIYFGGRPVTILKGKWFKTADPDVIAKCRRTRTQFENPKSPLLFDVVDPEVAEAMHKAETEKREPSATPNDPVMIELRPPNSQAEFDRLPEFVRKAMRDVEEMAKRARADADAILADALAEREEAQKLLEQATAAPPAAAPPAPPAGDAPEAEPKATEPEQKTKKKS